MVAPAKRVIGIDPGSITLGWGIVEKSGSKIIRIDSGIIRCGKRPLSERLGLIYAGLAEACAAHSPNAAAIEGIFHQKNAQSALVLGHARGAAMLALTHHGLVPSEYAPTIVKKAVTGTGRAEKSQVASMVGLILGTFQPKTHDETDALAIAICHLHAAAETPRFR